MKTVLVTGGRGLVGSVVVCDLIARGYSVISPHRNELDLSDENSCRAFMGSCGTIDVVVHCAALAHSSDLYTSVPVRTYNSLLVKNLVSAFDEIQPRIIFLSSIAVYDGVDNPIDCDHLSPPCKSQYGKGKLDDEQLLRNSIRSFAILRLAPFFNDANQQDVASRFYIVRNRLKLKIWPAPRFQFCSEELLLQSILQQIESSHNSIDIAADDCAEIINDLPGLTLLVPKFISVAFSKLAYIFLNDAMALKLKKALNPNFVEMRSALVLDDPKN